MAPLATLVIAAAAPLLALAPGANALRPAGGGGLQDLAAFPKYEVLFLNDRPLAASDASRCRTEGLVHDDDFMELRPRSRATIDAEATAGRERQQEGAKDDGDEEPHAGAPAPSIELMTLHFTHAGADAPHPYLCALPSANRTAAQTATAAEPHDEPPPDAAASWSALSHLEGQCLYARHRWFTYAYCHNQHIRQFREAQQTLPAPPEGYKPREDPDYDAYTLGLAHPKKHKKGTTRRSRKAGTGSEGDSHALAPEQTATFGVSPASRYLVQRWTDGTRCDKTGAPREVEVQVHCSMTSGDAIFMVKEVEICKYVVGINSPHLCSLPGFRAQSADDIVPVPIRCREVMSDAEFARWETEPRDEVQKDEVLQIADRPPTAGAADEALTGTDKTATAGSGPGTASTKGKHTAADSRKVTVRGMPTDTEDAQLKRIEEVLRKAFGGDRDGGPAIEAEVHVARLGDLDFGALGEELVPKAVEEGSGAKAGDAAGGDGAEDKVYFLPIDLGEEQGDLLGALGAGARGDDGDRRAVLEQLQKLIAQELAGHGGMKEKPRTKGEDIDNVEEIGNVEEKIEEDKTPADTPLEAVHDEL